MYAFHRMLRRVCLIALLVLVAALPASRLLAQSCTADVQCRDGGVAQTYCSGNAVVTARSVCIGSCRTVEDARVPCAGQCLAGRCIGAATALPPAGPAPWPRCAPGCSCRNKTLIITTGLWSAASGCEQRILRCARGCTCEPSPRCR